MHAFPRPPGEYDLRGVRGNEPGVDARFRRITLSGTFDGPLSQEELDCIAQQASLSGQGRRGTWQSLQLHMLLRLLDDHAALPLTSAPTLPFVG